MGAITQLIVNAIASLFNEVISSYLLRSVFLSIH